MPIAIVLVSGGLDSATCLAIARHDGFECHALSFRYGQRHHHEIDRARELVRDAGIAHTVVDLDLRAIGGSALTSDQEVPHHESVSDIDTGEIPVTYVPARNTIFLSIALAVAEVHDAGDVFIGVNAVDYSGYPDCRPAYLEAFEAMANLATRAGVQGRRLRIHAPLVELSKAEIIQRGLALGVDYARTTSCYDPAADGAACGRCDACLLRQRGFAECGLVDPARYVSRSLP